MADKKRRPRNSQSPRNSEIDVAAEQGYASALAAAEATPARAEAWDHAEEIAQKLQKPDDLAALYRQIINKPLDPAVREEIAKRAVSYHEEWFGDDVDALSALLGRIVEMDPKAGWAFERLVMELTDARRWTDLLAFYDQALSREKSTAARKRLLDEAAHIAKDFADQPDRAVDYMATLLEIDPESAQLRSSLERLYEKQGRWPALVDLWRAQIPTAKASEVSEIRHRIASTLIERLGDHASSLEEIRTLLETSPGNEGALVLLERILDAPEAPAPARMGALGLLRGVYDGLGRQADAVRAIGKAVAFAEGPERAKLSFEAGRRLSALGRHEEAIREFAILLKEQPGDHEVRRNLFSAAKAGGHNDLLAQALMEAAGSCEDEVVGIHLVTESAYLYRDKLKDPEKAIVLFTQVLQSEAADPRVKLNSAHMLVDLLAEVGRPKDRLEVLDRLAVLEPAESLRLAVIGTAARLAEEIGLSDVAISKWNERLARNSRDMEALDSLVDLYEASERWEPLAGVLAARASAGVRREQRRSDLVRRATILGRKLGNDEEAVATLLDVRKEFGDDPDTLEALESLLMSLERWSDLAEILTPAATTASGRTVALLERLGEVHHLHLGKPAAAADLYALAIAHEPRSEASRAGLIALLSEPEAMRTAALALSGAAESTDDWKLTLAITDALVLVAPDDATRARILSRAAFLGETRADDPAAALAAAGRALAILPGDLAAQATMERLAEATGAWSEAAEAIRAAASTAAAAGISTRASQLAATRARILEEKLADPAAALDGYEAAMGLDRSRVDLLTDAARVASVAGLWDRAARAVVKLAEERDTIPGETIAAIESEADRAGKWPDLARAMTTAVDDGEDELDSEVAYELTLRIAHWHLEKLNDTEAAAAAGQKAIAFDPTRLESIELVAGLERQAPGPGLVHTLTAIAELRPRSLDTLREAAGVAIDSGADPALVASTLERLYLRGATFLAGGMANEGREDAATVTAWALDRLVDMRIGARDEAGAARLLLGGKTLPLGQDALRSIRERAAGLLDGLGDASGALALLHEILMDRPDDVQTIKKASDLCSRTGLLHDLVSLKLRELDQTKDHDSRLALRLEISGIAEKLETTGGRVETVLANLAEQPGHADSIGALVAILGDRGQFGRLADVLAEQAERLEGSGDAKRAAEIWSMLASTADAKLGDRQRAESAWARVVALAPTSDALDALATLASARGDHAAAADWLEKRLALASGQERVPVLTRIARARLDGDRRSLAIEALEKAFSEAPRNAEVRRLLVDIYREGKDWESLVRVLGASADQVKDRTTILAYAHEVYDVCTQKLGSPDLAVPLLEKAHEVAPDDAEVMKSLALALVAAGRPEDARSLISKLIEGFGRRRTPERASLHLMMAKVHRALGRSGDALEELELASKMDRGNAAILHSLAATARESGDFDRAEQSYRTLLVTVRRRQEEEGADVPVGLGEIYLELARIAEARGQGDQARELRESALEAVLGNEADARNIQASLRAAGEFAFLRRVLEARLAGVRGPRARGRILSDLADLLEKDAKDDAGALEARLTAAQEDPVYPPHHEAALALARRIGKVDAYVSRLEGMLDQARRGTDSYVRCEILLRLGEVMHRDRGDDRKAVELYAQAEQTGVREVDVWKAQAELAGDMGDADEQRRVVEKLASLGETRADARASALYSMAEVLLSREDTLGEGIDTIRKALDADPLWDRAGRIMARGASRHAASKDFMALYERIARKCGDAHALLEWLETVAGGTDASPERIEEGVKIALELGEGERAEKLLLRAVDSVRESGGDSQKIGWALLMLAERRRAAGDLPGAVRWLAEAGGAADPEKLLALGREVAEAAAAPGGDPALAALMYEKLLESHPTARQAWEPLAGLYAQIGDLEKLGHLVEGTLDSLSGADDRSALRMLYAHALMGEGGDEDRAVEVLREVLVEQPDQDEARALLMERLEASGRTEDVVEMLRSGLLLAQTARDATRIKSTAMRLAAMLATESHAEAESVLRGALEWVPGDPDIAESLLGVMPEDADPRERAEVMERILSGKRGEEAADRALEIAEVYGYLEDAEGEMRVLITGLAAAPANVHLLGKLEQACATRGAHDLLAEKLESAAASASEQDARVDLLLRSARIRRETLGDPAGASAVLEKAMEAAPGDPRIVLELAATMRDSGRQDEAIERLTSVLSGEAGGWRLELLQMRSGMLIAAGRLPEAIGDLEEAVSLDASLSEELAKALGLERSRAASQGDTEAERAAVMRIADLELSQERPDLARQVLAEWTASMDGDADALRRIRDIDARTGNWEGVRDASARLAAAERGPGRIEAALEMARACAKMGGHGDARALLEAVHAESPDRADVRAALIAIYEKLEERPGLAALLRESAAAADEDEAKLFLLERAGTLLAEAGMTSEAVGVLREIQAMQPANIRNAAALADACIELGDLDAAAAAIDSTIASVKRVPEVGMLYQRRSRIAGAKGDLKGRLQLLAEAFKFDRKNGEIIAELANVAEKMGEFDLAQQALRAVPLIDGPCPISVVDSYVRQARLLLITGDPRRALMIAKKAQKEDPENPTVKAILSDLGE